MQHADEQSGGAGGNGGNDDNILGQPQPRQRRRPQRQARICRNPLRNLSFFFVDGGEEELTQHLNNMGDVASALGPQSQCYILHIAKQCHHIATLLHVHVSQWVIRQRRENRENKV